MPVFDRNQTEFPSAVHRLIWSRGRFVPPEISLSGIHDERRGAFLDLYHYMTALYMDMYEQPGAYHIDVEGLQAAAGRQTWGQTRSSAKYNKQKERAAKLEELERTNLPRMLCALMDYLKLENGVFCMDRLDYEKSIIKRIENKCRYKLGEDAFLTMLRRCGLCADRGDDVILFSNEKYPKMFEALMEWQSRIAPDKKWGKKYDFKFAFDYLDYRIFLPGFKITLENSRWYMSGEVSHYLTEIENTLSELGLKLKSERCTQLYCDYKDEHLVWFGMYIYPFFRVNMFRPGSPEAAVFEEEVNKLPNAEEIRAFCIKNLHRCRKCGCHKVHPLLLGIRTEFFGKPVRLCGAWYGFTTSDFDEKSLEIMKTLIKLNYQIILLWK